MESEESSRAKRRVSDDANSLDGGEVVEDDGRQVHHSLHHV